MYQIEKKVFYTLERTHPFLSSALARDIYIRFSHMK